jgi:dihydrofolate reductase
VLAREFPVGSHRERDPDDTAGAIRAKIPVGPTYNDPDIIARTAYNIVDRFTQHLGRTRPAARRFNAFRHLKETIVMKKVRVAGFGVSIDGLAAGTDQSLDHPLGKRGEEVFQWFFPTRTFRAMHGKEGGDTGPNETFAQRSMDGFGAFILGRNMFGPVRGEWPDEGWKGWWGENPPYHAPTFVLTHYPRASIEMLGGTTFHFVADGIEAALERARAAAGEKDIKIGGGVETVRQYLRAGHVDEIHLAVAPVVLGRGEALFAGIDLRELGYRTVEHVPTDRATHIVLAK